MNFWYLGTVTSSRYIQREDNRLVPQNLYGRGITMFETLATFKSGDAFLKCHSRFSPALAQPLSVLILLLAVALTTTSCGTLAQANGAQSTPNNLNLYGHFPAGTVSESYNAVLAV